MTFKKSDVTFSILHIVIRILQPSINSVDSKYCSENQLLCPLSTLCSENSIFLPSISMVTKSVYALSFIFKPLNERL